MSIMIIPHALAPSVKAIALAPRAVAASSRMRGVISPQSTSDLRREIAFLFPVAPSRRGNRGFFLPVSQPTATMAAGNAPVSAR